MLSRCVRSGNGGRVSREPSMVEKKNIHAVSLLRLIVNSDTEWDSSLGKLCLPTNS
jgi:hypothetical protein